ncbi:hypothetical protein HC891_12810 [Candidatus Gracilibacteria bacterium]|nr:hypothetical protein [Candidatus Gracilibacteria bacterium]
MAHQVRHSYPPLTGRRALLLRQCARACGPLLIACIVSAIGLFPVVALAMFRDIPVATLTRDIFAITGSEAYTGLLSNLGIMGWSAAAVIWLIGAALLMRTERTHFLLPLTFGAGLCTLWLLIDDAFMMHEERLPALLAMSEQAVILFYLIVALLLAVLSVTRILRTNYVLCLAACTLFAASLLADQVVPMSGVQLFIEDGLKFAGIVVWAVYAADTILHIGEDLYRHAER